MTRTVIARLLFLIAITGYYPIVSAMDLQPSSLRISGFGSIGLSHSDNSTIGIRDTIAQDGVFDEWSFNPVSKLGLQFDYQFSDRIKAGAQLVAKKRDTNNSLSDALHWAYLDFDISQSLSIRVGRMGQDIFSVSDYREVNFAQIWTHSPNEFYSLISTDFKDGVQFRHTQALGNGHLLSKLSISQSDAPAINDGSISEIKFSPNYDLSLEWENSNWLLRLSHSRGKASTNNLFLNAVQDLLKSAASLGWAQIAPHIDDFNLDDSWIRYYGAGLAYQKNNWIVQTELNHIDSESKLFSDINGGYLLLGKRFNDWTPFIVISKAESDKWTLPSAPAAFNPLRDSLQDFVHFGTIDQKTLGLGLRWDVKPNIAIKAQWDRTWIDPFGSYLYDVTDLQSDREMIDRYTVTLDFVF